MRLCVLPDPRLGGSDADAGPDASTYAWSECFVLLRTLVQSEKNATLSVFFLAPHGCSAEDFLHREVCSGPTPTPRCGYPLMGMRRKASIPPQGERPENSQSFFMKLFLQI